MEHELFLARQRIVAGKENAIFDEINVRQKVMSRAVADIQAIDEDIEHAKTDVKQEYEKSVAELKEISEKVKEQLNRFKTTQKDAPKEE
ncbi:Oidioi.mRNA.OKI2018_I69.PAR.g12670.t1.cds [Oikopleura dioica]|uniref:Oidioi.mRNA.OKI2018_I69.PAR.g12670.t1.cds n=1 Tax=Oikopleura dioica TaxID=34765 RepID=A0ABN7S126_OIKDI|nr:Oidioi.mRNA.OKI2018_I69.PAR.g12670.t1.cds [Oikopleura dioica]